MQNSYIKIKPNIFNSVISKIKRYNLQQLFIENDQTQMIQNFTQKLSKTLLRSILTSTFSTQYVASIDQSTTSTKFSVFQTNGKLVDKQIIQHRQITPQDGWLEHDPIEILQNTQQAIQNVLQRLSANKSIDFSISKIQGLGICNQRQTIICWDENGKPLHNAIVWCDTRTKQICEEFKKKYGDFKLLTGLPVSSYFTLFKLIWLAESVPEIKQRLMNGKIKLGTIDTWLIYNLTGKYVTDASNASRTYLCNLNGDWDESLLKLFKIRKEILPQIIGSFENVGQIQEGPLKGVPICSVLGDQQSSAFAHGIKKDQMKITYGTGCFLLSNIGNQPEIHDAFVTTILNQKEKKLSYAYEASVECGGGTLNWAHRAGLFNSYNELNSLPPMTHEELFFYPSFGSIFAPFWKSGVKGTWTGVNFGVTKQNMLYSILEAITFRLHDNIRFSQFDSVKQIFVDGGMAKNQQFMQLQADTFNKKIVVSQLDTCWGVAKGVLEAKNIQFQQMKQTPEVYIPNHQRHKQIVQRYARWNEERNRVYGWKNDDIPK